MAKLTGHSSSSRVSESQRGSIANQPIVPALSTDQPAKPKRVYYFINEVVEDQLRYYIWTGCTDVGLRDKIMSHATELIRQIIRKQRLHTIYPGQDDSAFGDLIQVGWCQVERTLYKFRARPHCRICYNPDRPNDSLLYNPAELEYGIIQYRELFQRGITHCPRCKTKLTPNPIVQAAQDLYGGSETIIFRGPSKVFNMWCVNPTTQLLTCHGPSQIGRLIEQFKDGYDVHVHGLDGISPIQAAKVRPKAVTRIVTTECGYSVEASPEHELLKLAPDGPKMTAVADLRLGDLLGIQYNQQLFGTHDDLSDIALTERGEWVPPPTLTVELAYLLGLFIAEGSYSYGKLVIYNIDREVIDTLANNTLGLNFIPEPKFQRISLCNVRFIEFLRRLGFPAHTSAKTKTVPERLLGCSRLITTALLIGMFDGDGHASRCGGTVGYTSTSATLIQQVRMLLLNLGMITKVSHDKRLSRQFTKQNGKTYISKLAGATQLVLSTADSKRFYDLIGFAIKHKQAKRRWLRPERPLYYGFTVAFRRLKEKFGCGQLGYNGLRSALRSMRCTLDTARAMLGNWRDHQDDKDYQFVADRLAEIAAADNNVVWLPVRSLVRSKSELCEISVNSKTHTYLANGIISHNSQVARTVILAYIKKEARDRKNANAYRDHIDNRSRPKDGKVARFLDEARVVCKFNEDHLRLIDSLERIWDTDDRPDSGIISKLVDVSGLPRTAVTSFIRMLRLRSLEFTDSPISRGSNVKPERQRYQSVENEDA